ncbi:hypothetical protein [Mucilaginibacter aquaedulcis]|uniref:hypothetical protein n=1 Tax=Mucilaginibacter aquaedulcis TaxID=1187081 RepID=UPI0025B37F58|nr:hypothetical protein [Mucilaginibacter aquaedulcis]MDN3547347.1 hypothetical protein [Mucilaginibacter aquaedulcis]
MLSFIATLTHGQTTDQIITQLRQVNAKVAGTPCSLGKGMLISNKAMNVFLNNKVSSYLSDGTDLSLYKNYVNLNTAEGRLSINHNFHQPVDSDDYVRSFVIVGARVNVANTYSSRFSNKYFNNQLGFALQKTWMGKPVTHYNNCDSQKFAIDAQRAVLLNSLAAELKTKASDYERALDSVKQSEVPGQSLTSARNTLRRDFYAALRLEYLQKFSEAQSDLLVQSNNFNLVTDNWTTFGVYLPIIPQKFQVGTDVGSDVSQRHNYPFEVFLTHTRFFESPKIGRIFFTLNGKGFVNNAIQSGLLYQADVNGSPAANGTEIVTINGGNRFIGNYRNFFTPAVSGKLVYIPGNSHVGVSFRMEKNFGTYHALNSILGIPIVLIDKKGAPAINFECQLLFVDMSNTIGKIQLPGNKTSIGVTVGIPFSKIVY